jgi:hypothetical protein
VSSGALAADAQRAAVALPTAEPLTSLGNLAVVGCSGLGDPGGFAWFRAWPVWYLHRSIRHSESLQLVTIRQCPLHVI